MNSDHSDPGHAALRRSAVIWIGVAAAAAVVVTILQVSVSRRSAELASRSERAADLLRDASAIEILRGMPLVAREVAPDSVDVIGPLSAALQSAGIDSKQMVSCAPQAPRRTPGSPHLELRHRILLDNVELRPLLVALATLQKDHPDLTLGGLQLRAVPGAQSLWNADLSVSALIVTPGTKASAADLVSR